MIQLRMYKEQSKPKKKTKENALIKPESWQKGVLGLPPAVMLFIFRLDHLHQKVLVLYGDRRRQCLHGILEFRTQEDIPQGLSQCCTGSMQNIIFARRSRLVLGSSTIRPRSNRTISQQKKHVPDSQLGRKGNGEVEKSQVPTSTISSSVDT